MTICRAIVRLSVFVTLCMSLSFTHVAVAVAGSCDDIRLHEGLISVQCDNATLAEVLRAVARETGIRLHIRDVDFLQKSSWSLVDRPLLEAVRQLVGTHNMAMTFAEGSGQEDDRRISSLWVFGNTAASQAALEAAMVEASPVTAGELRAEARENLSDPDSLVRLDAIQTLADSEDQNDVDILTRVMLEDDDPAVQEQARSVLEKRTGENVTAIVENGLGDADYLVRAETVRYLGQAEQGRVAPSLGQVLFSDPDPLIRLEAVLAIAQHHGEASRAFLQVAAKDEDSMVREAALYALSEREE